MLFSPHRCPRARFCVQESVARLSESNFLLVDKTITARTLFLHPCPFFCSFLSFFLSQTFTPLVIKSSCLSLNTNLSFP